MAQQTAVEWLKQKYIERGETLPSGVFQEAKEMEKEKIKDAYSIGYKNALNSMAGKEIITYEQYYNETYNK